jgi:hypothetical protein
MNLRWVERNGERVLQFGTFVVDPYARYDEIETVARLRWEDVQLEVEKRDDSKGFA